MIPPNKCSFLRLWLMFIKTFKFFKQKYVEHTRVSIYKEILTQYCNIVNGAKFFKNNSTAAVNLLQNNFNLYNADLHVVFVPASRSAT